MSNDILGLLSKQVAPKKGTVYLRTPEGRYILAPDLQYADLECPKYVMIPEQWQRQTRSVWLADPMKNPPVVT